MSDREKVIKGVECHRKKVQTTNAVSCLECPYSEPNPIREWCMSGLMDDIYVLLKEQEPRVLTIDEIKASSGTPCWFESAGTYNGQKGFWVVPSGFFEHYFGSTMTFVSIFDKSELGLSAYNKVLSEYNKVWRCWNSKPTEEQRWAVKWK